MGGEIPVGARRDSLQVAPGEEAEDAEEALESEGFRALQWHTVHCDGQQCTALGINAGLRFTPSVSSPVPLLQAPQFRYCNERDSLNDGHVTKQQLPS